MSVFGAKAEYRDGSSETSVTIFCLHYWIKTCFMFYPSSHFLFLFLSYRHIKLPVVCTQATERSPTDRLFKYLHFPSSEGFIILFIEMLAGMVFLAIKPFGLVDMGRVLEGQQNHRE